MDLILQIVAGLSYLVNKILFSFAENKSPKLKKSLKIKGWIIYIVGVPAWVIILTSNQNWIAASIEAGGIPAMLLGLYNTYYDNKKENKLFTTFVSINTYVFVAIGLTYSIIDNNGISSYSQVLEMGVMIGFLFGSYFMAKNHSSGWLFFMLMNLSMATLMLLENKSILMFQQLLSLCFVVYGFYQSKKQFTK